MGLGTSAHTKTNPDNDATASGGQITSGPGQIVEAPPEPTATVTLSLTDSSDAGATYTADLGDGTFTLLSLAPGHADTLDWPDEVVLTAGVDE